MSTCSKKKQKPLMPKRMKTPTVYQMEATECGAASLGMILGYYGKFVPLEKLRIETGVSRDGCNARNILRAARKFGLSCKGYTRDIDGLLKLPTPCILHWNFNHFVVFEGVRGKYFYINDPASGRRKLTREDIDDAFTGVVLCFDKEKDFVKTKRTSTLPSFIAKRLKGQTAAILGLFITGLILVVPGLVTPVFSQVFVDDILIGRNVSWIGALLAAMLGTALFQAFFVWLKGTLLRNLQVKMSLISAHKFLYRMFRLPISFFDQRYAGDLSQRVANNNNVSTFLSGELADTALSVFIAVFYLILLLIYSPLLTAIGVLGVAVNVALSVVASKLLSSVSMKAQQDQGKMVGALFSGLAITSTLKASGAENEYTARVLGHYAKNADTEQRLGKMQEILSAVPSVMSGAFSILVMMAGGIMVIEGDITAGMLVAFSQLLSAFTAPINQFVGFFQKMETLKADLNRVEDIEKYAVSPQFSDREIRDMTDKLTGNVELKGVAFGYSPLAPPVISDFNFTVQPGKTVALVGASGCGKSTVSKVISGLYDAWEGEVLFDGVPIREIPQEIINASIATVSQSITIFSGSIRDNLTMWNKSVSELDIVAAAKDACIHEAITRLPGAYDYHLDESGSNLSGGQRQRMEIARALVSNPSILLMDEATSALDPIVEKEVMDNIKRRGCTCIIVAHRLSTIRDCDEILVMKNGVIEERGTHEELKNAGGLYEALIRNE